MCVTVSLTLSTRGCREDAMENSAPNYGGTFSFKNECSFRLSGHASPAQRKPNSNSSLRSPVTALQKLGRNCSIYPHFISMLQEDFRLANKFPEVSTLAGPLYSGKFSLVQIFAKIPFLFQKKFSLFQFLRLALAWAIDHAPLLSPALQRTKDLPWETVGRRLK